LRVFGASGLDIANLAGDVVGPPTENQLESIQGNPLDLAGLGDGQVLGYDGGVWHPLTLPAPPDVPEAGTAIPLIEAGLGAPGASDKFAREDHVHPAVSLPTVPKPAKEIPLPDAGTGAVGTSDKYALEDHIHPAQDITGDFVEHPPVGRYLIVAAGWFKLPTTQGKKLVPVSPTYNKLSGSRAGTTSQQFILTFGKAVGTAMDQYVDPTGQSFTYLVKGTTTGKNAGFFHVIEFSKEGIIVNAAQANTEPVEGFMVEISLFGKFE
jgi:hypothetical protein